MKKLSLIVLAVIMMATLSCRKKDKSTDSPTTTSTTTTTTTTTTEEKDVTLEGDISSDMTLDASKNYTIKGKVFVLSGATLTIPAGMVIKGDKATQAALIVARGGKLIAEGTASQPIVFTSSAPAGYRQAGDWAGIVLLGNATTNTGSTSNLVEGLNNANGDAGYYGGSNDADNSGVLKFVRIEFAGVPLAPDKELNSLSMGGVGSGTTLSNIQVSYANDDAYEFFGGTVNAKYLIAYSTNDDDMDTDLGYSGKVQYAFIVRNPNIADKSGSRAFESSSSKTNATPNSAPHFVNVTVWGPTLFTKNTSSSQFSANYKSAVEINSGSNIKLENSVFLGFPDFYNNSSAGTSHALNNCVFGHDDGGLTATEITNKSVIANLGDLYGTDYASKNDVQNGGTSPTDNSANINTGKINFASPNPLLDANSTYKSGAPAVTGFDNTGYYGAFGTSADAGWGWSDGWVNFDPQNAAY